MARKWYFDGGGSAHAKTLRRLGFKCTQWTDVARHMTNDDGLTVAVPDEPWLSDEAKRYIVAMSGVKFDGYLVAWNSKAPSPGCPEKS